MDDITAYLNSASEPELKLLLADVRRRLKTPGHGQAEQTVRVAETTKCLGREELERVTGSFAAWKAASKNPSQQRSRNRIWLAFLLMRYGALRLGEVLALDDLNDIHPASCQVYVKGNSPRSVLLPEKVMRELAAILENPMFCGLRGKVFKLDPGYLRRKFYERANACGLSAAMFNPRVLRDSRAVELLRGNVPLRAVQAFMGQQNLNVTAGYLEFSDETASHFVDQYITREVKMKTSARNAFTGAISGLSGDGLLVEAVLRTLSGLEVVAVITEESRRNLALAEGKVVTATVKAPWVIITRPEGAQQTSARNKFPGAVTEVKRSELAAEIGVELTEGSRVCALVTRESADRLDLKPGDRVTAMFKAFAVVLQE